MTQSWVWMFSGRTLHRLQKKISFLSWCTNGHLQSLTQSKLCWRGTLNKAQTNHLFSFFLFLKRKPVFRNVFHAAGKFSVSQTLKQLRSFLVELTLCRMHGMFFSSFFQTGGKISSIMDSVSQTSKPRHNKFIFWVFSTFNPHKQPMQKWIT